MSREIVKSFCVFVVIGVATGAKINMSQVNTTTLLKPAFLTQMDPFWDHSFCDDFDDNEAFPHPDNCKDYLVCWQGEIWEQTCPPGQLFDAWEGFCRDAADARCLDEYCPPADSDVLRFLPSVYCDRYYICFNGHPVERFCRAGQHWNPVEQFCDDPRNARCDVRKLFNRYSTKKRRVFLRSCFSYKNIAILFLFTAQFSTAARLSSEIYWTKATSF